MTYKPAAIIFFEVICFTLWLPKWEVISSHSFINTGFFELYSVCSGCLVQVMEGFLWNRITFFSCMENSFSRARDFERPVFFSTRVFQSWVDIARLKEVCELVVVEKCKLDYMYDKVINNYFFYVMWTLHAALLS